MENVPLPVDDLVQIEHTMLATISEWLVNFVHHLGYPGIFIMTMLESTFIPIPSEVTMVPAGYLVHRGEMNFWLVWLMSILGSIAGSYINYWIAQHYGRRFMLAYGKYMFMKPERLQKLDHYFADHGEVSILTARLIPGLRHFISFPAGLARMDLKKFCIYTGIGSGIWMLILMLVGYFIGGNKHLVKEYMPLITYATLVVVVVGIFFYVHRFRKKQRRRKESQAYE